VRFAYADPPYLGCCRLYDHDHREPFGCWDRPEAHRLLIEQLTEDYPDGWALSGSSSSLRAIESMCPEDVRVAPWCKSFGAFKKGVRPAYMWEPVYFRGGRNPSAGHPHPPPPKNGRQTTPKDFHWTDVPLEAITGGLLAPITLRKGVTGAKPREFCQWVLDLLGYVEGDEIDDLFPGSGVMGDVVAQLRLAV
jgi:hypothetical protein